MNRSDDTKIRSAEASASEYLALVHALARVHGEFLNELNEDHSKLNEHAWHHLGEKVLAEEGDLPHAALAMVIASMTVYLAAIGRLNADELNSALDELVHAVGDIRKKTIGWMIPSHHLH
jgi:hypothetical protein